MELNRSDAAWKDANYAVLWEFLREEYELDERFESFDFKLEIIQVIDCQGLNWHF